MMTELERRALMGDPAAQQECTEKGIVLGCPNCGQKGEIHEIESTEKTCGRKKDVPKNARITRLFSIGGKKAGYFYKEKTFAIRCTKKSCRGRAYKPYKNLIDAIATWNTRPAPPIGLCGVCKFYTMLGHCKVHSAEPDQYGGGHFVEMSPTDYCGRFMAKESKENGSTID